jgi:hypothetical protein
MQKEQEPWDILCPSTISVAQEPRNVKKEEKGVQDMGYPYMQDTDYKIQDTAYMPGCKIQDTETGYSVYSIEDAGHKVQDTGCSVQYTEYTRLDAIQGTV